MLKKINVVPLAAESFGVRSMCTYVETPDVRLLLDAGASLAPRRFGFPPHPKEYQAITKCRQKIAETAQKVEVVTISHYHFDHHTPAYEDWCYNWSSAKVAEEIYSGKLVLVKGYRNMINPNQRRRGWIFRKTSGKHARNLKTADGKTFKFGNTLVKFSNPVFHGSENSELGWVLMATIQYSDEKALFAQDVQGPMCNSTLKEIVSERAGLISIGGPPTYLAGFRVKEEDIQRGLQNLITIVENTPVTILEHHLLREEKWRELCISVFNVASRTGHIVVTAAEFTGKENNLLESRRKQLFKAYPPTQEFKKWMRLPHLKRKRTKPPI